MFYTYILKLSNNTYYTGFSTDLRQRLAEHKTGNVDATKKYLPVELVYYSAFKSQKLATDFEKYLKSGSGFSFRNKHFI